MSDLMYDESSDYKKGMWEKYAIHDEENIKGMFGPYRWISNFWDCKVYFDGLTYKNSESAYQAAKLVRSLRGPFTQYSGYEAKKAWVEVSKEFPTEAIIPDWDNHKYRVMDIVVFDKFNRNERLKNLLLETGDKYIEETNWWHDIFWGVDVALGGENNLGRILMDIRTYFKNE